MKTASFSALVLPLVLALSGALASGAASAADFELALVIKDHRFEPSEPVVPANQRVRLTVHNQDSTPEEFESKALGREKIIPAKSKAVIFVGPLKPGRYTFVGEFHEDTAQGVLVVQ